MTHMLEIKTSSTGMARGKEEKEAVRTQETEAKEGMSRRPNMGSGNGKASPKKHRRKNSARSLDKYVKFTVKGSNGFGEDLRKGLLKCVVIFITVGIFWHVLNQVDVFGKVYEMLMDLGVKGLENNGAHRSSIHTLGTNAQSAHSHACHGKMEPSASAHDLNTPEGPYGAAEDIRPDMPSNNTHASAVAGAGSASNDNHSNSIAFDSLAGTAKGGLLDGLHRNGVNELVSLIYLGISVFIVNEIYWRTNYSVEENLIIIRHVGIQIESILKRENIVGVFRRVLRKVLGVNGGVSGPGSDARPDAEGPGDANGSQDDIESVVLSQHFIEMEKVVDLVINEGFLGCTVVYYLCVLVRMEPQHTRPTTKLYVVFEQILPRRAILETVYRRARDYLT